MSLAGGIPLHAALLSRQPQGVALFYESGADVIVVEQTRQSPLFTASLFWRLNVVKLLCENRAEINTIAASERLTPLHAALINCQEEVVKLLSQGAINAFREITDDFPVEPFSPLIESASSDGRLEVIKLLCEKGAEIKAMDLKGFTTLHLMSMSEYVDVVSFFLGTHDIDLDI
ncbi:ankyrin [Colletotrichum sublineola]|nr:ankyrin [Colletotrichum sublineola]